MAVSFISFKPKIAPNNHAKHFPSIRWNTPPLHSGPPFILSVMNTLVLRRYRESDIERLVILANNENVSRYLVDTFPYPYTKTDADWWITTGSKENGMVTKVIEWNGEFVGSVGITPQTGWRSHIAEIGYWLGEAYWGQGIATLSVRQMSAIAFDELGFNKLFAPVLAPNQASMKVLEKNGYLLEGILKEEVVKHDQNFDIHYYAKCRS